MSTLLAALTGRACPVKAKVDDELVFAYLRSLLHTQRGVAEVVDALAARTLGLQCSVKWGVGA